jgi:hypothetical protein
MGLTTVTGSPHEHGMRRQRIMPQRQEVSRRTPCPYDGGDKAGMSPALSFEMSHQAELSPRRSAVPRWFLFADNAAHLQPVNQSYADPLESFLRNVAQAGIDGGNVNASQTCHTDDRSGL